VRYRGEVETAPAMPDVKPSSREIHMWCLSQDDNDRNVEASREWLDPSEEARAALFTFTRDRHRFIVRHAFVRGVIALYIGIPPVAVTFDVEDGGKPRCTADKAPDFSVSTVGNESLLAISTTPIGVDIGIMADFTNESAMARRWLSAKERSRLGAVRADDRGRALVTALVRKEAVLKAVGCGLATDLSLVDTGLATSAPVRVVVPSSPASWWWVSDLHISAPFHAAVATTTPHHSAVWYRWYPQDSQSSQGASIR